MAPDPFDDTVAVPPRELTPAELSERDRLEDTVAIAGLTGPREDAAWGGLSEELAREISRDRNPTATVLHLVLPSGAEIALDTTVIVGRNPGAPRISVGPAPRLVSLPSPTREVSATHLEFRCVGSTVVVSDLRSTNGTTVAPPGAAPQVLLGGDSAVVVPGTIIDVGDGNLLRITAGPRTDNDPATSGTSS
ncbi:MAG: hypothetical protein CMF56_05335 [Leifsonia sp.]|nr:hypothetical protein [Leifsonia sp.]